MSYPGFEKVNAPGYPGNITIRMIACDYTGPLKIQIENHSNQWEFNFAVIQHTIGVKMVKVKDAGMSEFVEITDRKQYNVWSFFEIKENGYHKTLELPLTIQVISINDDIVEASIPEITIGKVFNAEGNFPIPKTDILTSKRFNQSRNQLTLNHVVLCSMMIMMLCTKMEKQMGFTLVNSQVEAQLITITIKTHQKDRLA